MSAYRLDTTSHLNANLNRVSLQATFILSRKIGLTKDQNIRLMRVRKEDIRRRDAEPAAWFYGPDRADWVRARMDRGEFKGKSDEELGRAFTGEELA
ncbi:hypothetical protein [Billgrantia montanilacus]|uniref:Uncharacterized protein n=1 Tax=Billgrantia montanilacus TaxID=2282305 RepID=A0A368U0F0_9GAMM|nr:hypothetical protein [Halomonas montanilacus]RCV90488.1 hypothetical protein DU505_06010 [Halomonas montanilacus]